MDLERLKDLVRIVGKERLVLDLSCRKKVQMVLFIFVGELHSRKRLRRKKLRR
jgi:hypothetical protein